jgi:hypothetical protein
MVSDNKFAVISYLDEDALLSLASLKGLITAGIGASAAGALGLGTGSSSSSESELNTLLSISSIMSQLLSSIRRQIVYNLVKDIIPNNGEGGDFNSPMEIFDYILYQYKTKYPEKFAQNIINNGFVLEDGTPNEDGYINTLYAATYFLGASAFTFTPYGETTGSFAEGFTSSSDAPLIQLFGLVKLYKDQLILQKELGITNSRLGMFFTGDLNNNTMTNQMTLGAILGGYIEGTDFVFNSSQLGEYNISIFHDLFGIMEGVFSREHDYHLVDPEHVEKNGLALMPLA